MKDNKENIYTKLSISQFAKYCGTTRQTLQFYDKIGLLRPALTGEQGYRYYNQPQGYDFRFITTLKNMGCSLDEIKLLINSSDEDSIFKVLQKRKQSIEEEISRLQTSKLILEKAQYLFTFNKLIPDSPAILDIKDEIVVTCFPFSQLVELESEEYKTERIKISDLCASLSFVQLHPSGFIVPKGEFLNSSRRFSHMFFMVHDYSLQEYLYTLPSGKFVVYKTFVSFPFQEKRKAAYDRLDDFIKQNRLAVRDNIMDISLKTPISPKNSGNYPILIFVPVEDKTE
jgi:DNA-binding transcriptional MerR regulator